MATATLQQAPEAPEKVNSFGRIVGVIFSPKETFESIARRPTWLVPDHFRLRSSRLRCMSMLASSRGLACLHRKTDGKDRPHGSRVSPTQQVMNRIVMVQV